MNQVKRKLEYPATNLVFWPGQEVMACRSHTAQLLKLNEVMGGAPLSVRPLADLGESGECSNCVNEGGRSG
jgi:hypothetical protein